MSDGPIGPEIAVLVECETWRTALPDVEETCRRVAAIALGAGGGVWRSGDIGRMEVSVVLADDALVRRLNREFRHQDKPTNVLSFPAIAEGEAVPADGPLVMGDVIIAYETTMAEAAREQKTLPNHLSHLVVHGVLHLLGHDHQDDDEAEAMERLETAVLDALGIPDPYAPTDGDDARP